MHKIWFTIEEANEWYYIIKELKTWFGNDWRGQRGVRKKLTTQHGYDANVNAGFMAYKRIRVWFLVPNLAFKTFMDLKMTNNLKLK
tara:strand:- start:701 stop:958 length:258 start_codon:yes stop_codon:yes gene_type:complete